MKKEEIELLEKMQGLLGEMIAKNTDEVYELFMKFDKKEQKKEFARYFIGNQCLEYIVNRIKDTDPETRKDIMDKSEMVKHILSAVASYLELGLSLGYTEKAE